MVYNNTTSLIALIDGKGRSMLRIHLNFNYKKATQMLNYFALKEGGQINKMKVLKLIYLADRYHLRKYGRLITNDVYFAMNYGPVPSAVKDIAESSDFLGQKEEEYSKKYITSSDPHSLKSVNIVDENTFSDTDIEALNFTWEHFGLINQFDLAELTHKYPEWKKHEGALQVDSRIQMYLEDFLNDPDPGIEKCYELSDQDRVARREHLAEIAQLESLWS